MTVNRARKQDIRERVSQQQQRYMQARTELATDPGELGGRRRGTVAPVVQLLSRDRTSLGEATAPLAVALGHAGLRVLVLDEYRPDVFLEARRPRRRTGKQERPAPNPPPAARSTVRWRGTGRGLVVDQKAQRKPREMPRRGTLAPPYEDPLKTAADHARRYFDLVLIADSCDITCSVARTQVADACISVARIRELPQSERRYNWQAGQRAASGHPLSPPQAAAVLRDRHLRYLDREPENRGVDVPLSGILCDSASERPTGEFAEAVFADMAACGVPLLGWLHSTTLRSVGAAWPTAAEDLPGGAQQTARTVRETFLS